MPWHKDPGSPKVRKRKIVEAFNLMVPRKAGNCEKCNTYRESLHRDHIRPKYLGGSDDPSNIQYLCANCHEDKSLVERRRNWMYEPKGERRVRQLQVKMLMEKWDRENPLPEDG
jgi:5-methylcytosine-specific restriction endonuclease McrA